MEEVGKSLWNVWKCLPKALASVWENVLILPPCLHILVINFLELLKEISLELVVFLFVKISDPYVE